MDTLTVQTDPSFFPLNCWEEGDTGIPELKGLHWQSAREVIITGEDERMRSPEDEMIRKEEEADAYDEAGRNLLIELGINRPTRLDDPMWDVVWCYLRKGIDGVIGLFFAPPDDTAHWGETRLAIFTFAEHLREEIFRRAEELKTADRYLPVNPYNKDRIAKAVFAERKDPKSRGWFSGLAHYLWGKNQAEWIIKQHVGYRKN